MTHNEIYSGADQNTNVDDILYARVRGTNGGVFKVVFTNPPSFEKVFVPSTSTSGSHAIAVDVVVHVFLNPAREFYGLERFWGDAKFEYITEDSEKTAVKTNQQALYHNKP